MTARRGFAVARAFGVGLAFAVATAACSGPYAGAPERLKKMPKKAEPEQVEAATVEIKMVDDCPVKFEDETKDWVKVNGKNTPAASRTVAQAEALLDEARGTSDDKTRAGQTIEAINKLRSALLNAPYHAEATYLLAHAYALTRRKGCAIALLKRLEALKGYTTYSSDATRMINQAESDNAFQLFRKEANQAINR